MKVISKKLITLSNSKTRGQQHHGRNAASSMHNNTAGPVISTTINNMLMDHTNNSPTKSNASA